MAKLSNLLHTSETFRRDLFVGFGIWVCLELIAFAVLPGLGITQPGDRLQGWLIVSLLAGLGGIFALALCPQYIERDRQHPNRWVRVFSVVGWRILAWIGFIGLAFPLLMISYELFTAMFSTLITG